MAAQCRVDNFYVLRRIQIALNMGDFPPINFKPLQVKCLEYLLQGKDVITVLPTGFGKSLIFHLLPYFLPIEKSKNIVIVVCPVNSIIEDQLKILDSRGIAAKVLTKGQDNISETLFSPTPGRQGHAAQGIEDNKISSDILAGEYSIIFAHPEALLCKEGRQLMTSQVFQDNVTACVIDEAHCVEIW